MRRLIKYVSMKADRFILAMARFDYPRKHFEFDQAQSADWHG